MRLALLAGWLLTCVAAINVWPSARRRRRWAGRFLGTSARLAGIRVACAGRLAAEPRLLLSNHLSWADVLLLGGAARSAFVARNSLEASPALRWLCGFNDTVFVAREHPETVATQVTRMREAIASERTLTLFPEGGTGDGIALRPLKSALLAAVEPAPLGLAIQPVWIDYGEDAPAIAWFGDEHGLTNFLRILARKRPLVATLHWLAPLGEAELRTRKTIAKAARARIAAAIADSP